MPRPKKNKEINTNNLISQLIEVVTDTYLNPSKNTADNDRWMYLNLLAEEFSMTPIKVRKLLISSGVYQTDVRKNILDNLCFTLKREAKFTSRFRL